MLLGFIVTLTAITESHVPVVTLNGYSFIISNVYMHNA